MRRVTLTICAAALLLAGCNKTADKSVNYKSAIDAYYSAHPSCLWPQPKQFPVQVAASNDDQKAPYDALVDQGLLVRSTSEKKIIIVSRREINYDLSDTGRSDWTADPNQPGYGNFCYGHRDVNSIDSVTPNSGQPGATAVVNYHYSLSNVPEWAQRAEIKAAFPDLQSALNGNGVATATLADTNSGWQVESTSSQTNAVTSADGAVVQ